MNNLKSAVSEMTPFAIPAGDEALDDLRRRLQATRWPDVIAGSGWSYGTDSAVLQKICRHWAEAFDWREWQERLNRLPQYRVTVNGFSLHVVHAPSDSPKAVPLLLTNGWPSSIVEYLDVIPRLVSAGFHVVAPALPGYGFSDRPTAPGMNSTRIADLFVNLMQILGHARFVAHGSDMGAGVVESIRRRHPESLIGAHFSNVYWGYPPPENPSPDEAEYLKRVQGWQFAEGAYAMVQGTKPQTLSYGLNDSPAGLAGWIVEKLQSWTDGGVEALGLDAVCANLTIYWLTETIGSSARLYAEAFADKEAQTPAERGTVPVGVIVFPRDILPAPRAWGDRWLNLVRWTEAPRGGHFGAWEEPSIFVDDIAAFAASIASQSPR